MHWAKYHLDFFLFFFCSSPFNQTVFLSGNYVFYYKHVRFHNQAIPTFSRKYMTFFTQANHACFWFTQHKKLIKVSNLQIYLKQTTTLDLMVWKIQGSNQGASSTSVQKLTVARNSLCIAICWGKTKKICGFLSLEDVIFLVDLLCYQKPKIKLQMMGTQQ